MRGRIKSTTAEKLTLASVLIPKYCAFDPSLLAPRGAPQARLEGRSRAQRRRYCMLDHPSRRRAARGPQDEVGALPRRPTAPVNRTNFESRTLVLIPSFVRFRFGLRRFRGF